MENQYSGLVHGEEIISQSTVLAVREFNGVVLDARGYLVSYVGDSWPEIRDSETHFYVESVSGERASAELVGVDERIALAVLKSSEAVRRDILLGKEMAGKRLEFARWREGGWALAAAAVVDVKDGLGPDLMILARFAERAASLVGDGCLAIDELGRFLGVVTKGKTAGFGGNVSTLQLLPASVMKDSLREVLATGGNVKAGWLGIYLDDETDQVRVKEIELESPAFKAGLRLGDTIVALGNEAVASKEGFIQGIRWSGAGSRINLTVQREGLRAKVFPELAERPAAKEAVAWAVEIPKVWNQQGVEQAASVRFYPLRLPPPLNLGLTLDSVTPQLAEYFKLPERNGLLVKSVLENSVGERFGFRAGDVLLEVNDVSLDSPNDLKKVIEKSSDGVLLIRFSRDGVVAKKRFLLE